MRCSTETMNKPTLYILCGCPGSGKSTWANTFVDNLINIKYVSRDEIRFSIVKNDEEYFSHEEEVFAEFINTIRRNLLEGWDTIADATHLNKKSRKKLLRAIDFNGTINCQIIFVYFATSFVTCLHRNELREGRARVPDEVIKSMWVNFEEPSMLEDERCIGLWRMKGE